MLPGFVPFSRAGFMMDFIAVAMLVFTPVLLASVILLAKQKRFEQHRRVQMILAYMLLAAVLLFEIDVRLFGWRHLAEVSPYYETYLFPVLYLHLLCAVSCAGLWAWTIFGAHKAWGLRLTPKAQSTYERITGNGLPGRYSAHHRRLGWATTLLTCATTITGWTFYLMAFVA